MSYLFGKFVWFEHHSRNPDAAARFYLDLLGWVSKTEPLGTGSYTMLLNGEQGIGGLEASDSDLPSHWVGYLSVPDVDAAAEAVAAAGGKVLLPPTDFGPVGRGAAFLDPQGAAFSVWKSADGDGEDKVAPPPGTFCWHELMTPNPVAAVAFYEKVFGFTHESMEMGEQGTYYVLKMNGTARAGVMLNPGTEAPAAWMPYVAVADTDAVMAQVGKLGGEEIAPPFDVSHIGRVGVLADTTGAALGVIGPIRE